MTLPPSTSSLALPLTDEAGLIVKKSKSSFSSSFFFLSLEKRKAIERVYAFFRVIDDVVDEEPDPQKQKAALDFWRQELDRTYQNAATLPFMRELAESINRFKIPKNYFLKLIEGCEADINTKRYQTFQELSHYCYLVASIVGLTCMKIFEHETDTSEKSAISLGIALQLTNIIRDVGVDLQKGRIYLPQEDLNRFGVTEHDLQTGSGHYQQLMKFEYERTLPYYEEGMAELKKDSEKKLLAARIMGEVYRQLLEKIRKAHYPVDRKVKLSFTEKMLILARCMISHYLF
jgi:phytoene synthase